jgi:hypothetical protein
MSPVQKGFPERGEEFAACFAAQKTGERRGLISIDRIVPLPSVLIDREGF